jgi:hypothetical protein
MNFYANLRYLMRFYPKSAKLSLRKENTFSFFLIVFHFLFYKKIGLPHKNGKGFLLHYWFLIEVKYSLVKLLVVDFKEVLNEISLCQFFKMSRRENQRVHLLICNSEFAFELRIIERNKQKGRAISDSTFGFWYLITKYGSFKPFPSPLKFLIILTG